MLTPEWTSTNNVVRFPVEKSRLPGESRVQHSNRLEAYDAYDKLAGLYGPTKMQQIIDEIASVIDEFEEEENPDGV